MDTMTTGQSDSCNP